MPYFLSLSRFHDSYNNKNFMLRFKIIPYHVLHKISLIYHKLNITYSNVFNDFFFHQNNNHLSNFLTDRILISIRDVHVIFIKFHVNHQMNNKNLQPLPSRTIKMKRGRMNIKIMTDVFRNHNKIDFTKKIIALLLSYINKRKFWMIK